MANRKPPNRERPYWRGTIAKEMRDAVVALSKATGRPQSQIVEDALSDYFTNLRIAALNARIRDLEGLPPRTSKDILADLDRAEAMMAALGGANKGGGDGTPGST